MIKMITRTLVLIAFSILSWSALTQQTESGWRGIRPLHSTRKDVEQLLGTSLDKCRCLYKTKDETIFAEYAQNKCKGSVPGWNVPADSLLRLTVRSKIQPEFSSINVDLNRYQVRQDDTFTKYYFNGDEGIEYSVSPDGKITAVTYTPKTTDHHLRCSGFPLDNVSFTQPIPFDQYSDLDFNNEMGRLDNFAVMLERDRNLKGYILVYAGKISCPREAKYRGNRARSYLIRRRALAPSRVAMIDGGYRERFAVELYVLPHNAEPPDSTPNISQTEVKIVKSRRCRS